MQPWRIWIDTGGTFTDCLAIDPRNPQGYLRAKVLSTGALRGAIERRIGPRQFVVRQNWGACRDFITGMRFSRLNRPDRPSMVKAFDPDPSVIELDDDPGSDALGGVAFEIRGAEPAPILAARLVTATAAGQPLPPIEMRLATTRGTNALLERRGAPMALFITQGFGDLLLIGDQQRPELFALDIHKPPPLHQAVVEVRERLAADGSVLRTLEVEHLEGEAKRVLAAGMRIAAVALVHSHVRPDHEKQVESILRAVGFTHVSCSSDLAPLIRILPRAQTAVVDAYLAPVIGEHLSAVRARGGSASLQLHAMTSAGGLVRADRFHACDSLLSGPAGGVVGAAAAGIASGFRQTIGFDMGGTSTDVARFDGEYEYTFEQVVGGARLMSPALAIETVAAGGGSICDFVDDRLLVGPRSAGADPGPACYGLGGPLTLTDVNLLLGRLSERQFEIPISRAASESAWSALAERIERRSVQPVQREELLEGFLAIANERMAAAIEEVSVRQGYDPRDYALLAFGGAGGQHACAVAERLGMTTVILPEDASLLSAKGLGAALIERFAHRQVLQRLDQCRSALPGWFDALEQQAMAALRDEGVALDSISQRRRLINLRLLGQDSSLSVEYERSADLIAEFRRHYRARYGTEPPLQRKPIEVESLRVTATAGERTIAAAATTVHRHQSATDDQMRARFSGRWIEAPVFSRARLKPGAILDGPAIVLERRSALVVEAGWRAEMDGVKALVLRRADSALATVAPRPELVEVELFSNRLTAMAADMGQMLQRTALSTNVKERLDFSCAVLDAAGQLVVNAPHIPVHLGALGACVRAVRDAVAMNDGDVIVTNHPALGGSHLPDVTVITPVFAHASLIGYVASRAHHAEIGGARSGSMPPNATTLAEEGVVIPPMHVLRGSRSCFEDVERILCGGPYPSRAVEDNLADLQAMTAANQRGAELLRSLCTLLGPSTMQQRMSALNQRAEHLARAALATRRGHRHHAVEHLDDGSPIAVSIDFTHDPVVIDFAGSAAQHRGNLNATPAIVRSAVMYVLRLLIGERLPLNEGIMRAVEVRIPPGMLNPHFDDDPAKCPAVVGGNVETSQRLVDTLLKALDLCACSQGTMNNILFGNDRFGYYETVCGGAGAGNGFNGADAVHTHMTNTRITDPEIIEHRYPVRVERFAIRRGSGGMGRFRGGDGTVREITFLEPMSLSVLSQHRVHPPFGMHGGDAGSVGRQRVFRPAGEVIELKSIDGCEVRPGDRLVLETPGGGGWGAARDKASTSAG